MPQKGKKLRLLLFTGKNAEADLTALDWKVLEKRYIITIQSISPGIIAFLSVDQLKQALEKFDSEEFDYVLVSGLIPWDVSSIGGKWGAKIKKGPKFLVRIPEILSSIDPELLSSIESADILLKQSGNDRYQQLLQQNLQKVRSPEYTNGFALSNQHPNLWFSPDLPPLIIAEIVDFPRLSQIELDRKIAYYIASGADVIDLGCIANEDNSDYITQILPRVRSEFSIPFSIDSVNPKEIRAAVSGGIELVLSVNFDNYEELLDLPKDLCIVLIPASFKNDFHPQEPGERIQALMQLGKVMSEHGFKKLLLDPITDSTISPGFIPTLETLSQLQQGIKHLPSKDENGQSIIHPQLFMGFGNLTELIDADSPGINALLTLLAAELDVTAILTTEYSHKTRKSIEEIANSRQLTYLAKQLHVPPINLGINALWTKTKHRYPRYSPAHELIVDVKSPEVPAEMDPTGFFKIFLDPLQNRIIISHYSNAGKDLKPTITIMGTTAESVYKEIFARDLVSRLDHAAYLGKELQRAELALKLGAEYIQE